MKSFFVIAFACIAVLQASSKFDGMDIVYINGIMNDEKDHVKPSSEELSRAIELPVGRVKYVYNHSAGFWNDLMETYAYANFDGTNGGKDFTKFWLATDFKKRYGNDVEKIRKWQLREYVDDFVSNQRDYQKVYQKIKAIRSASSNKKLLILSHSEGTLIANLVMKRLEEEYGKKANECTGLVSIATPVATVVGIRNNGLYTTSNKDAVIGMIRPDVGSLPSNINTVYDGQNNSLGHALVEIYLNRGTAFVINPYKPVGNQHEWIRPHEHIRKKIIKDINTMTDRINANCKPPKPPKPKPKPVYSTEVTFSPSTWMIGRMKDGDTMDFSITIHHKRDGKEYSVVDLDKILNFWYESGEYDNYISDAKHYHIACRSSISGLCTYLRNSVPSDSNIYAGHNKWTIYTWGMGNFISNIENALKAKYRPN